MKQVRCIAIAITIAILGALPSQAEKVVVFSQDARLASEDLNTVLSDSKVRLLHANPHSGALLLETEDIATADSIERSLPAVFRDLEVFFPENILHVIVSLKDPLEEDALNRVTEAALFLESRGATELWRSKYFGQFLIRMPIDRLEELDLVEGATYQFDLPESLPSLPQSVPLIGVVPPYGPTYWPSSTEVQVAVVDTGVVDGPPLAGRVNHSYGACFSGGENEWPPPTLPYTSICPNGGFSEIGYQYVFPVGYVASGRECRPTPLPWPAPPTHLCEHGTHVANVAASDHSQKTGVNAAAQFEIIPIQVYSRHPDSVNFPNTFQAYPSDQVKALEYVYGLVPLTNINIAAVTLSINSINTVQNFPCNNNSLAIPIAALKQNFVATIISAGNVFTAGPTGSTPYNGVASPACISDAITVGAANDTAPYAVSNDTVDIASGQYFNTRAGDMIDIWAPGANIRAKRMPLFTPSGAPGSWITSGTSHAVPHVAAIWARLRAKYGLLSDQTILNAMTTACGQLTDPRTGGVTRPKLCMHPTWN